MLCSLHATMINILLVREVASYEAKYSVQCVTEIQCMMHACNERM